MKKKVVPILAALVLIVIVAVIGVTTKLIEKYIPSDQRVDAKTYYNLQTDQETALIVSEQLVEKKGIIENGVAYIDYDTVKEHLNHRFFWDANENQLRYTTPVDVISVGVGSKEYSVLNTNNTENYNIVKVDGSQVYIAADFVKKFTQMEYQVFEDPNRMVITNNFGDTNVSTLKKAGEIRTTGGVKSDIVYSAKKGESLGVIEKMDKWSKVITEDGYIGYIENKLLSESKVVERTYTGDVVEPEYTSLTKDTKINLVWHNTTNQDANARLLDLLSTTKGLTTIAPTWFSVADADGNIDSSLASETYVSHAHDKKLEVWGVVTDFPTEESPIDIDEILSYSSKRDTMTNQLIAVAINYNLDGINVDFEHIGIGVPEDQLNDAGENFIQFIRELSVKCRKNGIILSVDNLVPQSFNAYYNRKEQGIVADYVINMGYDEHHATDDTAGPVASLPYVKQSIEDTVAEVDSKKVINAVPFYSRLWTEKTDENGETVLESASYGMDTSQNILNQKGVEKVWLEDVGSYYAEFEDENGLNKIWLEEEDSMELKVQLIKEYDLGGVAEWCLSYERPSIWDVILKYVN